LFWDFLASTSILKTNFEKLGSTYNSTSFEDNHPEKSFGPQSLAVGKGTGIIIEGKPAVAGDPRLPTRLERRLELGMGSPTVKVGR
jgi:hypothetical protein